MSGEPRVGEDFAEHILDLRGVEFDRMKTLEGRGALILRTDLAILGGAAALATFTLGRSASPLHVSPATAVGAILSLIAFVVSILHAARVQGGTSDYMLTSDETLDKMVGEKWRAPAEEAGLITSKRNVESIQSLRPENEVRAKRLKKALRFQIAFILLLVVTGTIEIGARLL
jgi:hypothetical protein